MLIFSCGEFNPFSAGGVEPGFNDTPTPTPTPTTTPTPTPTPIPNILYFVDANFINKVYVDGTGKETLYTRADDPTFLRIDTQNSKLYWLESGSLLSGSLEGGDATVSLAVDPSPNTITCFTLDYVNSRIYYTFPNEVYYTSLTSPGAGTFVAGAQTPTLVDSAANGYVYWITTHTINPTIYSFDGSSTSNEYSTEYLAPSYFLRVDRSNAVLYFHDNGVLMGYNVPDMTYAFNKSIIGMPFHDLCIDGAGGYLYFTTDTSITRTDLEGENQIDVLTSLSSPAGIDILIQ